MSMTKGHKGHHHRKSGGKTHMQMYNAQGSNEAKEAEDETAEFKRGGKAKKHGGHAEGKMAHHRGDKKPRHKRASGGRTPYSSGSVTSSPSESGKTNSGHESQRP